MSDEKEKLAKEVSEFLHESCQHLQVRHHGIAAYLRGLSYKTDHPVDGTKCRVFPVVTGSTAEFYIDPMLKCVGDLDFMYHYSSELAIPAGHRPPTELPTDFDSRVKVFEIVDSHVPGYVYLQLAYILTKSKTDSKYIIAEHVNGPNTVLSHEFYVIAGVQEDAEIHGPSACISGVNDGLMKVVPADTVPCIRCLMWPTQADDWPTRHRNYDWPYPETVERVVRNGCDVVGVAHTPCTQDEWMSKHQWRLSFSRAEAVLLNSWSPIQQIVYHMIRFFTKAERLINNADNTGKSTLNNYHIKTMMLWACERKPLYWWSDKSNLVSLFAQCLYFLEEWITKRRGCHYFIKNVYFLDYIDTLAVDTVTAVVKSITEDCLAQWFFDNYMHKCAEQCPDITMPILRSDMATSDIARDIATAILKSKSHDSASAWMYGALSVFNGICLPTFRSWEVEPMNFSFTTDRVRISSSFVHEMPQQERNAFRMLWDGDLEFNANENKGASWDLKGYASLFYSKSERHGLHSTYSNEGSSYLWLGEAVAWMRKVAAKHFKNHPVVHVNLAKTYLLRAMRCADCDSDSIYGLANVYMAVLCYTTGQQQKATDYCTLVTRSQSYSQCTSRVVDGEILPKNDDDIDTVLGLVVFYQYVRTTTLKHGQPTRHAGVFTIEFFARYFNIRHLLVAKCRLAPKAQEKHALREVKFHLCEELKLFFSRIVSAARLFLTDVMLVKFSNNSSLHRISNIKITNLDSLNKQQLVEMMTKIPIPQMLLTCGQLTLVQDVDPEFVAVVKTSDFMPLRLYRCKLYERCAQLCQRAVHEMIDGHVRPITRLCFLYNEFVQLMDDDIVSLIGMTVLVGKSGTQSKSKLRKTINISELTMSLYLLTQCQIKIQSSALKPDILQVSNTLNLINEAEKFIPSKDVLGHLILKLAERLSMMCITNLLNFSDQNSTDTGWCHRLWYTWYTWDTCALEFEQFHFFQSI